MNWACPRVSALRASRGRAPPGYRPRGAAPPRDRLAAPSVPLTHAPCRALWREELLHRLMWITQIMNHSPSRSADIGAKHLSPITDSNNKS